MPREAPHPSVVRGVALFPSALVEAPRQLQLVDSSLDLGQVGVHLHTRIRIETTLLEPDRHRKWWFPREIAWLAPGKEERTTEHYFMGTTPSVLCTSQSSQ